MAKRRNSEIRMRICDSSGCERITINAPKELLSGMKGSTTTRTRVRKRRR